MKLSLRLLSFCIFSAFAYSAHAINQAEGCSGQPVIPATDKNVFNWRTYLNTNQDLYSPGGIKDAAGACWHWVNFGVKERRQAHAGFHAGQYLYRYPDLAQAFGLTGDEKAMNHYLKHGIDEQRIGYLDNGMQYQEVTRTTVQGTASSGKKIFVSASKRTAGAIDSLMLGDFEFINSFDHGRELQIALATAKDGGYDNPTEAGSCADGLTANTTSIRNVVNAYSPSGLYTEITPGLLVQEGQQLPGAGIRSEQGGQRRQQ